MAHITDDRFAPDFSIVFGGDSPSVAIDRFNPDRTPQNLSASTGSIIFYTLFRLKENAASGQKVITVIDVDDTDQVDHLIKANDTLTIGTRDSVTHTVDTVSNLAITMDVNLTNSYVIGETVKVIWKTGTLATANFVLGFDSPGSTTIGTVKNRVTFNLADTETDRIFENHRILIKVKDSSGNELAIPDPPQELILNVFDDINRVSLT